MQDKARILVVEDERIVAEDIRRSLLNLGYHVVGMASSGKEALSLVRTHLPDLILMDIVIKGRMTGIDTTRKVRSEFNIPVVYLTAYADLQTLEQAKSTDPFGYILKPFNDRELQSTIEMALYKHAMEQRLRESEAWFSTTLGSMVDGVVATDEKSNIIFFNKAAEALTGWPGSEAAGRPIGDVILLRDGSDNTVIEPVPDWPESGGPVRAGHQDTWLITRSGRHVPVDESSAPIRNQQGDILGTVLVLKDITQRRKAQEEAQEERDFINTLLHISPAYYVAINADGKVLMMNDAACQALGYSRDEVEGRPFADTFFPADSQDHTSRRLQELMLSRETFEGETRVLTRDGNIRLVAWHGKSVLKTHGDFDFYFVMGMDITDRRETEKALRHSEERYRGLFETMAQGVVYFDRAGAVIASNPAAEEILGRSLTEMVGKSVSDPCWDSVTEAGLPILDADHPVLRAMQSGLAQSDRVIGVLRPGGDRRWLLMNAAPVGEALTEERRGSVFATFTDITQRKEMEFQLSRRNFQLKGLNELASRVGGSLELLPIAESALEEALRLTGLGMGVLLLFDQRGGQEDYAVHQGLDEETAQSLLGEAKARDALLFSAIRAGEIITLSHQDFSTGLRLSADHVKKNMRLSALVLPLREAARIIGALLLFDEATRIIKGADMTFLTQVGHHIGLAVHNGRLYRSSNQSLEKLKITQEKLVESEKLAGLGAMASNVVHEIGNPLAAISNSIQVLQGRLQLEGRMKELLDIIGWETERLERSVNELREFSRPKRLQFTSCDMAEVVRKAVFVLDQDVELTFGKKIVQKMSSRLPAVSIDPDAMEQVAINLLKNSLQAVHEGGVVEVILKKERRRAKSGILLEIKDNGPGIPKENLERIFEPYFSTKARGMGLGMHIVKTAVEAHGGFLTLNSEEGKGTSVQVHIPILRGDHD